MTEYKVGDRTITVEIKTLWPEDAKELLALNTRNRAISSKRVEVLVNDILEGAYKFNGDTIRLASIDAADHHPAQWCGFKELPYPVPYPVHLSNV